MKPSIALATAFLFLLAMPAQAACELTIDPVTAVSRTYDPFSAVETQLPFRIVARNTGDQTCQADLFLKPDGGRLALAGPGGDLRYGFERPGGLLSGASMGPVRILVGPGESSTTEFDAVIAAGAVIAPGSYASDIAFDVMEADGRTITDRKIALAATVSARAQMSISGVSAPSRSSIGQAPPTIDFGLLETGETRSVFVNVWANTSVRVTLSSQNHGLLRAEAAPGAPGIGYSVTFDGAAVNLGGVAAVDRTPPMTSSGASYPLAVTIGNVEGRYAGRYSDIITVTVDNS